ncbi:MAG: prepilin peptidase [Deltaproteobacteria bacterium]|nr:prepilin peptidase [Deltaproteobacteria bacterium]
MDPHFMISVLVFALAICIGSFLNVCIYRIPLRESIVSPPSHCPACAHRIPWYHNLPLASYVLLRGRCEFCGARISPVYPLVEFGTGVVALLLFLDFGLSILFPVYFVLAPMNALIGALLGGGLLLAVVIGYYLLTKREGMGLGDVKLLAMIGAFLGWKGVLFTLFSSSVVGALSGMAVMVVKKGDMKLAIPFGPFLSLGAVLYIFVGERLIGWYLNMF